MSRARVTQNPPDDLLQILGDADAPVELKLELLTAARGSSAEASRRIDEALVTESAKLRQGLRAAQETQTKLAAAIETLTAPPLLPAVVLACDGKTILAAQGGARRVVEIDSEYDGGELSPGDEVLLASGGNVVLRRSPYRILTGGDTAAFERYLGDRLVLKSRDEEIVVDPIGEASRCEWRPGDLARWERSLYLATERIPRSEGENLWLDDTPEETFDDIGGLDEQIRRIHDALRLGFAQSDVGRRYGAKIVRCLLLHGPPGTGKTLLARAIANWLASLTRDRRSYFMHVRPGEFLSMWVGEAERRVRETFRVARDAADRNPDLVVVVFLDEIDSVAARRGRSLNGVDDRLVCALADEINGFADRPNVAVIGATNRTDVLDPALTRAGRFGELSIAIPRPNRRAAREILLRHIAPELPCAVPGCEGEDARRALVDAALSSLYAPNATGELLRLTLRDGSVRPVHARDLVSGASLAKIVRTAAHLAALRDASGQGEGVRREDVIAAAEEEIERAAALLTAANARAYLQDLPEDLDVMSVASARKKAPKAHRYLRIA